jgi:hypothetical protein
VYREIDSPNEKLRFDLAGEKSFATGLAIRDRPAWGALIAPGADGFNYHFQIRPGVVQGLLD